MEMEALPEGAALPSPQQEEKIHLEVLPMSSRYVAAIQRNTVLAARARAATGEYVESGGSDPGPDP